MKPIINPMWIYLADVSEVSKILLLVLSVFLLIIGIVIYFGAEDLFFDADTEKNYKIGKINDCNWNNINVYRNIVT